RSASGSNRLVALEIRADGVWGDRSFAIRSRVFRIGSPLREPVESAAKGAYLQLFDFAPTAICVTRYVDSQPNYIFFDILVDKGRFKWRGRLNDDDSFDIEPADVTPKPPPSPASSHSSAQPST